MTTTRRRIDPDHAKGIYGLLSALVVPRPIAWVSTRGRDGVDNLAPHSFYQVVSSAPPIVMVSTIGVKDTARHVRETGEFVVCGTPTSLIREINLTAVEFGPHDSEYDRVGLTREPSERVAPPRVAQSPYALECRLVDMRTVGNGTVIFGEVVLIAVDETAMDGHRVATERLGLISRLGGSSWATLGTVIDLPRLTLAQFQEGLDPSPVVHPHPAAD